MNGINQYYQDEAEEGASLNSGLLRANNILRQREYWKGQLKQFGITIRHPGIDYSIDSDKRTVAIVPGLSCSVPTYHRLIQEITKDGKFNVLKLEDFPEDFKAMYSRLSLTHRAELLLNTLEKHDQGAVSLVGHSIGGPVAAYAKILAQSKGNDDMINKVITLSAPMRGSVGLKNLPLLPRWFKSVSELNPESSFMNRLSKEGQVDDRFVTLRDEIIRRGEMDFDNGKEHELDHGHFDYMLGIPEVVADTASQIVQVLNSK